MARSIVRRDRRDRRDRRVMGGVEEAGTPGHREAGQPGPGPYSHRKASIGSVFAARLAGITLAKTTTSINTPVTDPKEIGSIGLTPSKVDRIA